VVNKGAPSVRQIEGSFQLRGDASDTDSEPPVAYRSRLDEVVDGSNDVVDRDREAQSNTSSRLGGDPRVDPHNLTAQVDEGSAAVPAIDRGVGLDEVADVTAGPPRLPTALTIPAVTVD
jgi:hypothetical protein